MPRVSFDAAAREVARRDPRLAAVTKYLGPVGWRPRSQDAFASLVRAIAFQQLAGRAAAAIHDRFLALMPNGLTPVAVLALSEASMLGAGLSRAKVASIRDLAGKVADSSVPLDSLRRVSDDEIVRRITAVRGIGRWTAEMFLIFQLRRMDVWPVDDLGVRRGWARIHGLPESPTAKTLHTEGERFRPYRTVVAIYCWRAAVTPLPATPEGD